MEVFGRKKWFTVNTDIGFHQSIIIATCIKNSPSAEDILEFSDMGDVTMEYKDKNSLFYSGTDYLGVANGVQLTRQEDETFA